TRLKVVVYALFMNKAWGWKVSLDISIDYAFWFEQFGNAVSIAVLESAVSLGQAYALTSELNKHVGKGKQIMDEKRLRSMVQEALRKAKIKLQDHDGLPVKMINYREYLWNVNGRISDDAKQASRLVG